MSCFCFKVVLFFPTTLHPLIFPFLTTVEFQWKISANVETSTDCCVSLVLMFYIDSVVCDLAYSFIMSSLKVFSRFICRMIWVQLKGRSLDKNTRGSIKLWRWLASCPLLRNSMCYNEQQGSPWTNIFISIHLLTDYFFSKSDPGHFSMCHWIR